MVSRNNKFPHCVRDFGGRFPLRSRLHSASSRSLTTFAISAGGLALRLRLHTRSSRSLTPFGISAGGSRFAHASIAPQIDSAPTGRYYGAPIFTVELLKLVS